jgi:DNA-directed RNA polymerase beta' subunit
MMLHILTLTPEVSGLYDRRMGPVEKGRETCQTCHLVSGACPGHFGHIEVSHPVYNPFFLELLVKLMNRNVQKNQSF